MKPHNIYKDKIKYFEDKNYIMFISRFISNHDKFIFFVGTTFKRKINIFSFKEEQGSFRYKLKNLFPNFRVEPYMNLVTIERKYGKIYTRSMYKYGIILPDHSKSVHIRESIILDYYLEDYF